MHRDNVKTVSSVQFLLDTTNLSDHLTVKVYLFIPRVRCPLSIQ